MRLYMGSYPTKSLPLGAVSEIISFFTFFLSQVKIFYGMFVLKP